MLAEGLAAWDNWQSGAARCWTGSCGDLSGWQATCWDGSCTAIPCFPRPERQCNCRSNYHRPNNGRRGRESAMNTILISVAAATLGWQTGYQRLPEGGMEYIIQLDSAALDALRDGQTDWQLHSGRRWRSAVVPHHRGHRQAEAGGAVAREAVAPPKAAEKPATPPRRPRRSNQPQPETPAKPWLPLTLTLLALFASIGANLFLGWIAWGLRRRCQNAS